jgi:hypothetical protein
MFETYRMLGAERERELLDVARRANAPAARRIRTGFALRGRFRAVLATGLRRKVVRWRPM